MIILIKVVLNSACFTVCVLVFVCVRVFVRSLLSRSLSLSFAAKACLRSRLPASVLLLDDDDDDDDYGHSQGDRERQRYCTSHWSQRQPTSCRTDREEEFAHTE